MGINLAKETKFWTYPWKTCQNSSIHERKDEVLNEETHILPVKLNNNFFSSIKFSQKKKYIFLTEEIFFICVTNIFKFIRCLVWKWKSTNSRNKRLELIKKNGVSRNIYYACDPCHLFEHSCHNINRKITFKWNFDQNTVVFLPPHLYYTFSDTPTNWGIFI